MKRILVCDDEQSIREAMETFLEGEGYEAVLAEDGSQALEEFKKDKFEAVFMDVKMPGIDGIECMREMKRIDPEAKVVIITGLPDETTFDRAVSVSDHAAEGFIAKPFKPEDLRKVLENIASGKAVSAFQLNPYQLNALGKIGETGAENAAYSFTQAVKTDTKLRVEKIRIVPFSTLSNADEQESDNAAMLIKFSGDISGGILLMFSWKNGMALIDLMEKKPGGTTSTYDSTGQQTLKTAGNILAVSYINAVKASIEARVNTQMPELIFDKKSGILERTPEAFNLTELIGPNDYIFTIENELIIGDAEVRGHLIFIPDGDSVKKILKHHGTLN